MRSARARACILPLRVSRWANWSSCDTSPGLKSFSVLRSRGGGLLLNAVPVRRCPSDFIAPLGHSLRAFLASGEIHSAVGAGPLAAGPLAAELVLAGVAVAALSAA